MNQDKRQLRILFVWSLLAWIVAAGLLPLLPVHARRLGATPGVVGAYMASAYVAIAAGSLLAAWLARRRHRRRRWAIAASAGTPIGLGLMAWAANVWGLAGATALAWLCFGLMAAIGNTLVGLRAEEAERGRAFGALGMTQGLGTLIGGALMGPAADRWGYRGMFLLAAGVGALLTATSLFLKDAQAAEPDEARPESGAAAHLGRRYWAYLGAFFLIAIAYFCGLVSQPLLMNEQGFRAAAISSTASITGLVGLLAQPAAGWLSDHVGRRNLLAAAFGVMALALWMLAASIALWHFWLAAALMALSNARTPLQRALVADTLSDASLGLGLALLAASGWVGGIIGFGVGGHALEAVGAQATLWGAALLPALAIGLLIAARPGMREPGGRQT